MNNSLLYYYHREKSENLRSEKSQTQPQAMWAFKVLSMQGKSECCFWMEAPFSVFLYSTSGV